MDVALSCHWKGQRLISWQHTPASFLWSDLVLCLQDLQPPWKVVGNESCTERTHRNVPCSPQSTHSVLWLCGQITQSFPFPWKTQQLWPWHNRFPYFGKCSYCSPRRLQLCQWRCNRNPICLPYWDAADLGSFCCIIYGLEGVPASGASTHHFCCLLAGKTKPLRQVSGFVHTPSSKSHNVKCASVVLKQTKVSCGWDFPICGLLGREQKQTLSGCSRLPVSLFFCSPSDRFLLPAGVASLLLQPWE